MKVDPGHFCLLKSCSKVTQIILNNNSMFSPRASWFFHVGEAKIWSIRDRLSQKVDPDWRKLIPNTFANFYRFWMILWSNTKIGYDFNITGHFCINWEPLLNQKNYLWKVFRGRDPLFTNRDPLWGKVDPDFHQIYAVPVCCWKKRKRTIMMITWHCRYLPRAPLLSVT